MKKKTFRRLKRSAGVQTGDYMEGTESQVKQTIGVKAQKQKVIVENRTKPIMKCDMNKDQLKVSAVDLKQTDRILGYSIGPYNDQTMRWEGLKLLHSLSLSNAPGSSNTEHFL